MWRHSAMISVCVVIAVMLTQHLPNSEAATDRLLAPNNVQCACPGDILNFTCTVIGIGNTLWRGSTFNCPDTTNEIILRHSQFSRSEGTSGNCNNGAIVARSVDVAGNCFRSQLNVNVSASFNNRNVQCDHNSNTGTRRIGTSTLNVISASNPYPPPNDVNLTDIGEGEVTFNWSSPCSSIVYVITSDCGVCPNSTNSTSVTCSGLQLPTQSDGVVCSISISSRACGVMGSSSTPGVLAVPGVPSFRIIPSYSNESQALEQLLVNITVNNYTAIIIGNDISGSLTSYNVTYSRNTLLETAIIPSNFVSCEGDVCSYTVDASSTLCSPLTDFNISLAAINRIGQGPLSDAVTIGCTNEFVKVKFNSSTSIFSCEFLNKLDNSEKFCEIAFGVSVPKFINNSTAENPNRVSVNLTSLEDGTYFYVVTASSDITTITLKGKFVKGTQEANNLTVILGIVIPVTIILVVIIIVVIVIVVIVIVISRHCKRKHSDEPAYYSVQNNTVTETDTLKTKLKLKVTDRRFQQYPVDQNYALREFIERQQPKIEFWRGYVYYELTDEEEDISKDKELILQKKTKPQGKFYSPQVDSDTLLAEGFKGEGITKAKFGDMYRVFVQSKGSGKRHLAVGTYLIYEEQKQDYTPLEQGVRFLPIPSYYFASDRVSKDDTNFKDILKKHNMKNYKNVCMEIDPESDTEADDVFVMDKHTKMISSGPLARQMIVNNTKGDDKDQFRVYALCKHDTNKKFKRDTHYLYEDPNYIVGIFRVLEVDEENVRMSTFVRKMIGAFEKGKVFYEFTEIEDLLCYRKIVRVPLGKTSLLDIETWKRKHLNGKVIRVKKVDDLLHVSQLKLPLDPDAKEELQASMESFYAIPGTPGIGISPPKLETFKDFIHSPSQGSRCLKKGTFLLYCCEYRRLKPGQTAERSSDEEENSKEEQQKQPVLKADPTLNINTEGTEQRLQK